MPDIARVPIDGLVTVLKEMASSRGKPIDCLDPGARFFDLGIIDSLSLLDFISFIEKHYGLVIDGADIVPEHFESLAAVSAYLEKRLGAHAPHDHCSR
jgi:acyl carrier protein